jgi:hypothetical protein
MSSMITALELDFLTTEEIDNLSGRTELDVEAQVVSDYETLGYEALDPSPPGVKSELQQQHVQNLRFSTTGIHRLDGSVVS